MFDPEEPSSSSLLLSSAPGKMVTVCLCDKDWSAHSREWQQINTSNHKLQHKQNQNLVTDPANPIPQTKKGFPRFHKGKYLCTATGMHKTQNSMQHISCLGIAHINFHTESSLNQFYICFSVSFMCLKITVFWGRMEVSLFLRLSNLLQHHRNLYFPNRQEYESGFD